MGIKKKIVTVANQKGGVAKSTTTAQVGAYTAKSGLRTILFDLDPSCSLSLKFLKMERGLGSGDGYSPPPHPEDEKTYSTAALFNGEDWKPYPTETPNLFILPSTSTNYQLKGHLSKKNAMREFMNWMNMEELWNAFNVGFLDTPPEKDFYSEAALLAATDVLIPCPMEKAAFEGLGAILQYIELVNDPLPPEECAKIIGILPTIFQSRTGIAKHFLEKLRSNPVLSRFATPFVITYRPTYQEVEMMALEKPYEVRQTQKTEAAFQEWSTLGEYVIKKMGL